MVELGMGGGLLTMVEDTIDGLVGGGLDGGSGDCRLLVTVGLWVIFGLGGVTIGLSVLVDRM